MPENLTVETVRPQQDDGDNAARGTSSYRPEIDGLRALAVVAVIINHFNKDILPSGYLGVDIFFVISGYVITSSLARRESRNFWNFITSFYERRIRRLAPALVVFVLITSVLICLVNPNPTDSLKVGQRALFGFSNITLYRASTDYFAQTTELNPFTHTWSLGVEEQFYLLFPALAWLSGFGRQTQKGGRNLAWVVGVLAVSSLLSFIYLYQVNQPAAYFLMPPRFWELATGCLICLGLRQRYWAMEKLASCPPIPVVVAMLGTMFLPVQAAVPATISMVGLSALLICCLRYQTLVYRLFTLEKVVYIGLISYSLYLWHWGVLCISRWTIDIHWWSIPFQIGIILYLAILSFQVVEAPIRNRSPKNSTKPINFNTALVAFSGLTLLTFWASDKALSSRLYVFRMGDYEYQFGNSSIQGTKINTITCMTNYSRPQTEPRNISNLTSQIIQNCSLAPRNKSNRRMFFIGDSQSDHLKALANLINQELGLGVQVAAVTSTIYPTVYYESNGGENLTLQARRGKIQEGIVSHTIERAKNGDIVVLSGRYSAYFGSPNLPLHMRNLKLSRRLLKDQNKEVSTPQYLEEWLGRLSNFLGQLSKKGVNVILFLPTPEFPYAGPKCLNGSKEDCLSNRNWLLENRSSFVNRVLAIKVQHKNLFIYDPFTTLCPISSTCETLDKDGKSLFRDATHLSNHGSSFLLKDFRSFISNNKILREDK